MSSCGLKTKFVHCISGPAANPENGDISLPPGRRLVVPLNICVVQGMRLVRARLLSMEIPARFTEAQLRPVSGKDDTSTGNDTERTNINLLKIDPYKGSWGLCLLELELFNPTDVVFDVTPISRRSEIYFTLLVSDFIVLFFFLFFFFSDKCQSAAIFD